MQDVARGKVFGLWICGAANAVGGGKVVGSVPELNIGPQQQPIGARFSERHADAAGVHDSSRADHPVKLHVGMAADDQGDAEPSKIGRRRSSGVRRVMISVSLRGVAWQNSTSPMPGISIRHVGGQPSISCWCVV